MSRAARRRRGGFGVSVGVDRRAAAEAGACTVCTETPRGTTALVDVASATESIGGWGREGIAANRSSAKGYVSQHPPSIGSWAEDEEAVATAANRLLLAQDWQGALNGFTALLRRQQGVADRPDYWMRAGVALLHLGRLREAAAHLLLAATLPPPPLNSVAGDAADSDLGASATAARALLALGRTAAARAALERAPLPGSKPAHLPSKPALNAARGSKPAVDAAAALVLEEVAAAERSAADAAALLDGPLQAPTLASGYRGMPPPPPPPPAAAETAGGEEDFAAAAPTRTAAELAGRAAELAGRTAELSPAAALPTVMPFKFNVQSREAMEALAMACITNKSPALPKVVNRGELLEVNVRTR